MHDPARARGRRSRRRRHIQGVVLVVAFLAVVATGAWAVTVTDPLRIITIQGSTVHFYGDVVVDGKMIPKYQ